VLEYIIKSLSPTLRANLMCYTAGMIEYAKLATLFWIIPVFWINAASGHSDVGFRPTRNLHPAHACRIDVRLLRCAGHRISTR
jgi:hypothetical protein